MRTGLLGADDLMLPGHQPRQTRGLIQPILEGVVPCEKRPGLLQVGPRVDGGVLGPPVLPDASPGDPPQRRGEQDHGERCQLGSGHRATCRPMPTTTRLALGTGTLSSDGTLVVIGRRARLLAVAPSLPVRPQSPDDAAHR